MEKIFDMEKTFLHNININVIFTPRLMYYVDGEVGVPEWTNVGTFELLLTNINEKIRSFA
jgi:hypothetical protein